MPNIQHPVRVSVEYNWLLYLPDVSLTDQHTCMMDGLGQSQFEHLGLETTLQEIFDFQTQHVIELHVGLIQHTDADQTTQQSVT